MVRPQTAGAFGVALAEACRDVGLLPPSSVTEHGDHVRFWWTAKPRRAWAQLDAEGEVLLCLEPHPGAPLDLVEQAGDGVCEDGYKRKALRDCLARVKAYLAGGAP